MTEAILRSSFQSSPRNTEYKDEGDYLFAACIRRVICVLLFRFMLFLWVNGLGPSMRALKWGTLGFSRAMVGVASQFLLFYGRDVGNSRFMLADDWTVNHTHDTSKKMPQASVQWK